VLSGLGGKLIRLGTLAALPFAAAIKAEASYEGALASLRAAANPTAADLKKIEAAIQDISRASGVGPTKVAQAMTELLKAGLPLEGVLGGSTAAAIKFAKVAEMDVAEAATALTDAMNVFGADATTTVDVLSKAADASSISVRDVTQAFSAAGAVAKQAGLGISETANAIAILGQNGVKGSDAGTSLKSMLLRLQTGAESAGQVMAMLGIGVRKADGSMKNMRGIIGELETKLSGLRGQARDKALLDLFGSDAIRAGSILINKGVKGLDEFAGKMKESLPVGQKFDILMGSLGGSAEKAWASFQRLGIAVGEALAPSIQKLAGHLAAALDGISIWVKENKELILTVGKAVVGVIGLGAGLVVAGTALTSVVGILGGLASVLAVVHNPIGLLATGLAAATVASIDFQAAGSNAARFIGGGFQEMGEIAGAVLGGIVSALKTGDIAAAGNIAMLALKAVWAKGAVALRSIWLELTLGFQDAIGSAVAAMNGMWVKGWAFFQDSAIRAFGAVQKLFFDWLGEQQKAFAVFKAALTGKNPVAELIGIDEDTRKKKGVIDRFTDVAIRAHAPGRRAGLDRIEFERKAASDQRRAEAEKDPGLAAAGLEVDRARKELAEAIAQANAESLGSAVGGAFASVLGGPETPAGKETPAETNPIEAAVQQVERTVDVKGSFSASALKGLGAGDTVADRIIDLKKEAEKQNKTLEKISGKLDAAAVFKA
jgi:TP901 family phage tail tape measure protein